jgi:hypothetical protein
MGLYGFWRVIIDLIFYRGYLTTIWILLNHTKSKKKIMMKPLPHIVSVADVPPLNILESKEHRVNC